MLKEKMTVQKLYSVTDRHVEMVDEIMEKKGFLSKSEVIRYAIATTYEKDFPDYIYRKTAKDMEKRGKIKDTKKLEAMSPVEYAEKFIGKILVAHSEDGHDYIIAHGLSNMLTAIRDDKVKKYVEEYPDLVELHQKKVGETSVASELDTYMVNLLKQEYGIDFGGNLPEDSKAYEQLNAQQK